MYIVLNKCRVTFAAQRERLAVEPAYELIPESVYETMLQGEGLPLGPGLGVLLESLTVDGSTPRANLRFFNTGPGTYFVLPEPGNEVSVLDPRRPYVLGPSEVLLLKRAEKADDVFLEPGAQIYALSLDERTLSLS